MFRAVIASFAPPRLAKPLLLASLLGAGLGGGAALAKTLPVHGHFAAEAPATTTPTGAVAGSFDTATDTLTYSITYDGLSGPVVAAHFHGPAKLGAAAGVMKPIDGPYDSPIKGTVTLDSSQAKALEHGMVYVNLHTAADPNGEARAQLHVRHGK